ncbi:discoidin domain-containing protein [Paenibacillus profundus]|uniref:Discoidin domain-containing protein n=1 Tax=Paenibacillus profundus TaxID=1173085 RepID=A0ABS8YBX4_9BACL|nr:discoidin domain-containing protein [Paenibacillus profundus]MCE5168477.1 discoidin domain-containing protein [Paenibacillus profundus]
MRRYKYLFLIFLFTVVSFSVSNETNATPESISLIPKMESANSPSGKATASEEFKGLPAYKAFDGIPHYSVDGIFTSWGTSSQTGWLKYEFDTEKVATKYVLYKGGYGTNNAFPDVVQPASWTFEGSNDGDTWIILDDIKEYTSWIEGPNEFSISNDKAFKHYRLNVSKNTGGANYQVNLSIHEMEIWGYSPEQVPDPKPDPEEPEQPNRAILVVTMITGLEKEFDLSMEEVNAFITWYESKQAGSGTASYAINKHNNNKGPFSSRKDYVIFDKILTFEVNEYSIK